MIIKKEEEGKGILAKIPQPSRFQMNRLLNAHFPESDANPTITNENRERKLNDPINAISNVIMTSPVLQPAVKMLAAGSSDEPCCAYYKAADMYQSRMA